jgi:hypothetical protein
MKRQNVAAIVTLGVLLAVAASLARLGSNRLQLQVEPRGDGSVAITLLNRTDKPARFYDSLSNLQAAEAPGLTTIRLRNAQGEILTPMLARAEGFWSGDISLVKRLPVILDTLPPNMAVQANTSLGTLLKGYPEQALEGATQAQIRCAVFLEEGVVNVQTAWFPLPNFDRKL